MTSTTMPSPSVAGIPMYRLMDTKAHMRDDGLPYAEAAQIAMEVARGERTLTVSEADALNLVPDDLRGMDRFVARAEVIEQITSEGLAVMVPGEPDDSDGRVCFATDDVPACRGQEDHAALRRPLEGRDRTDC